MARLVFIGVSSCVRRRARACTIGWVGLGLVLGELGGARGREIKSGGGAGRARGGAAGTREELEGGGRQVKRRSEGGGLDWPFVGLASCHTIREARREPGKAAAAAKVPTSGLLAVR